MSFFPPGIENLIFHRCFDPGIVIDKLISFCYVASQLIPELLEISFEYKTAVLNIEQEKESTNHERV